MVWLILLFLTGVSPLFLLPGARQLVQAVLLPLLARAFGPPASAGENTACSNAFVSGNPVLCRGPDVSFYGGEDRLPSTVAA